MSQAQRPEIGLFADPLSNDVLQRFMLQGAPVRGELVSLDTAWREVTQRHVFPRAVRT